MYNPRGQIYGDVAILTYIESVEGEVDGRPTSYTRKGYDGVHQAGRAWRGVRYHESKNPGGR